MHSKILICLLNQSTKQNQSTKKVQKKGLPNEITAHKPKIIT